MRILYILQTVAVVLVFALPAAAEVNTGDENNTTAQGSTGWGGSAKHLGKYIWGGPYHNDVIIYLNNAKIKHNSQWDDDEWSPQMWIDARGGDVLSVINGFYKAGIVVDQYSNAEGPVLEVGQTFLELSDLEKQHMVAFFDYVFGITTGEGPGVIQVLFHEETYPLNLYDGRLMVGYFTKDGLQLQ